MTYDDDEASEDPTAERAAKGLLTGWIVAKTTPWLMRIAIWGAWLAAVGAYGGYVWWRVRRMVRAQGVTNIGEWLHRPDPPR